MEIIAILAQIIRSFYGYIDLNDGIIDQTEEIIDQFEEIIDHINEIIDQADGIIGYIEGIRDQFLSNYQQNRSYFRPYGSMIPSSW